MITSKLTSKAQTTIPAPVPTAPGLKAGDELVYSVERDRVVSTKGARTSGLGRPINGLMANFEPYLSANPRVYTD